MRLFHPWGHEPEEEVVRLRRSGSHVVALSQGLKFDGSCWVPSKLVGVHKGPVWIRMFVVHPYGSIESSVRARRVQSDHINSSQDSIAFLSETQFDMTGPVRV